MRLLLFYFILVLVAGSVKAQDSSAVFAINAESKEHPYKSAIKYAQDHYTWYVNGVPLTYHTGTYPVPVNDSCFDTIFFVRTSMRSEYSMQEGKKFRKKIRVLHTEQSRILCRLKPGHHYSIFNPVRGFTVFSLDTFNIKKDVSVAIKNFQREDTLHLTIGYHSYEIYSDTLIRYKSANEKMEENFETPIRLDDEKYVIRRDSAPSDSKTTFFVTNYLFLHGEQLKISYDLLKEEPDITIVE